MDGKELREMRKRMRLTLIQMANVFGLTAGMLSLIENGKAGVSAQLSNDADTLASLDADEREKRIRGILGKDIGYKQTGVRATGVLARALMNKRPQYDIGIAFKIASIYLYGEPRAFDELAMFDAYQKASSKSLNVTQTQLREMLKIGKRIAKC